MALLVRTRVGGSCEELPRACEQGDDRQDEIERTFHRMSPCALVGGDVLLAQHVAMSGGSRLNVFCISVQIIDLLADNALRGLDGGSTKDGRGVELDLGRYELRRFGRRVKLERKPMELLIFLVSRRDQLVTRDEIVKKLWRWICLSIRNEI